jgi:dipeptidyl aminopeptidase/acylaminoacyl peptidase
VLLNIPKIKMPKNGYPVIIVNHGYIPPNIYSTVNSYHLITDYYAANGFLVLKPDYRGHDKSENSDEAPYDRLNYVIDVLTLLNSILSLKEADLNNIFVYGHSMGGDITLRLIEITDKVKGATLWAPVSAAFPENFLYFVRKRDTKLADKLNEIIEYKFKKEEYGKISAIANTHYIKTPLVIHHGTLDESVPYEWSLSLTDILSRNKVNYKFYTYKDDHNFSKGNFYIVLKKDVDFFKSLIK